MKSISIDIETFSSVSLQRSGVYRYAESPDFEVLLFGYSADGGEVQVVDLANGEKIPPDVLAALEDDTVTKWAFNANFERVCLSLYLGYPTGEYLKPESWRCSMIWSAYMGLPLSLVGAGAVLGLEKQKLTEGKDLIKYFCQPCAPTKANGGRVRNLPEHAPDKWSLFKAYNKRDVEVEMSIQQRLAKFPVPEDVWEEYHIDQEINDRGVRLDMELVRQAIAMDERSRCALTDAMKRITSLNNPNSVQQMKQWLADNGLETESLGKKTVVELLKTAPPELAEVLTLRQQLAKSSIRKYQAMENTVCSDGRARGMFQFYGANRSGRWAGRNIQLQNLPQNHLPDLAEARALVRTGDFDTVSLLYEDVPDTLSQLIRTAFIPREGALFYVADFSAIEARVIAWFAGETWRQEVFENGGDIYCMSASQMFKVPVEKRGVNGHLRQKGKIAELACIAEGQLVLTDWGLVPIEEVTTNHRLWDGESWVSHSGVIYKGEREVITYEGLTATPDHLVWIEGESRPVQLREAARSSAHLLQTGNGGETIRLGENNQSGEAMERKNESLLCSDGMSGLRKYSMAEPGEPDVWKVTRVPALLPATADSEVDVQEVICCQTEVRKPILPWIRKLWRKGHNIRFSKCNRGWALPDKNVGCAKQRYGVGQDRHKRKLCARESALCSSQDKLYQSAKMCPVGIQAGILAVFTPGCNKKAVSRDDERRNYTGCRNCCNCKEKKLANHQRTARLYDIRNAGPNHRFTVSGKLVHNCGYGGSVGALKAMGALEMGLQEEELKPLVDSWRTANPNIVKFWWAVDHAVTKAVREKTTTKTHGLTFSCRSGMLFITLPSGRKLAYVKPRIGENRFGGDCVTYEGIGGAKKWERLESYGPKFVENIVQATARDILCYAMKTLRCCSIVMHIHDELVIEADPAMSLDAVCEQMSRTPPWAEGLRLRADGYVTEFYRKD